MNTPEPTNTENYAWLSSILDELRVGNKVYGVVEAHIAIVEHIRRVTLEARHDQIELDFLQYSIDLDVDESKLITIRDIQHRVADDDARNITKGLQEMEGTHDTNS